MPSSATVFQLGFVGAVPYKGISHCRRQDYWYNVGCLGLLVYDRRLATRTSMWCENFMEKVVEDVVGKGQGM